jgi:hypothetical protein
MCYLCEQREKVGEAFKRLKDIAIQVDVNHQSKLQHSEVTFEDMDVAYQMFKRAIEEQTPLDEAGPEEIVCYMRTALTNAKR